MSRRAFLRQGSLLVVAALLLVTGLAQPGADVLCLGRDGHAAVEAVGGGCCGGDAPRAAAAMGAAALEGASSCGDCLDVELDSELAGSKRVELCPPHAASVHGAAAVAPAARSGERLGCFNRSPAPPRDLAILATVVLLT